jgi:AraC-like DNA-binding protein
LTLNLTASLPVVAAGGGLLVSRGLGRHPDRVVPYFDLIFVRSGVLGIQEEGKRFAVGAGQTLLLWPGRRHGGTKPYAADLSFYWTHFTLSAAGANPKRDEGAAWAALEAPQLATLSRPAHMTALCRRFLDDQEDAQDPVSAALLVLLMLREIVRPPLPGEGAQRASAGLAQRADAYIRTHFHQKISVATLADELGCNPNYLSRVYRQVYRLNATEAIHRRRLDHARRLLLDSIANIDEIARESGFDDPGYFRRLFKRHQGITPLAYRRLYARVYVNTE